MKQTANLRGQPTRQRDHSSPSRGWHHPFSSPSAAPPPSRQPPSGWAGTPLSMDRDAGTDLGKARALAVEINTYDIREWRQTDVPGDPEVVADAQDGGGAILSSAHSATGGLGLDLSGTGTQSAEEVEMSTREWVEPDDGTECTERLSDVAVASDPGVRRCAKEEPLAERASQCQHAGSATHSSSAHSSQSAVPQPRPTVDQKPVRVRSRP